MTNKFQISKISKFKTSKASIIGIYLNFDICLLGFYLTTHYSNLSAKR